MDNDPTAVETLKATRDSAVTVPGSDRTYLEGSNVVLGDIRELTAGDLIGTAKGRRKKLDLVAGGPPCQPFSSAGKQRGLADPRGSLFRDFVRIVDELDPKYVLFENVLLLKVNGLINVTLDADALYDADVSGDVQLRETLSLGVSVGLL